MIVPVRFFKYHGLGNDFVLLDLRSGGAPPDASRAREMCDRHFGIGADGVLTMTRAGDADAALHIFNADGSEPESCGNGIRCAARALLGPARGKVRLQTPSGLVECFVDGGEVEVEMGVARVGAPLGIEAGGRAWSLVPVDIGNPHAIVFLADAEADARAELCALHGPAIETHAAFPARTNVEFAAVRGPGAIDLAVWERGAGATLACGTGACATAAAAVRLGLARAGEPIVVTLPGGPLRIVVGSDGRVRMRGPVVKVFEGEM